MKIMTIYSANIFLVACMCQNLQGRRQNNSIVDLSDITHTHLVVITGSHLVVKAHSHLVAIACPQRIVQAIAQSQAFMW